MPIVTPGDLISYSLKNAGVLGVGQTALAEDYSDAFTTLNAMMALWTRRRWMVHHLIDVAQVTTGAQSYSVGPGGDFNMPRMDRLEAVYVRQNYLHIDTGGGVAPTVVLDGPGDALILDGSGGTLVLDGTAADVASTPVASVGAAPVVNLSLGPAAPSAPIAPSVDYPLDLLESMEDYSKIRLKAMSSWPNFAFYDSGWPLGHVYVWPVPQQGLFELHLVVKDTLTGFSSYTQTINLPPEYFEPLWTNLTVRLAPIYQFPVRPDIVGLAKGSLETIRGTNTQVPRMSMPQALRGRAKYNIFSDSVYG